MSWRGLIILVLAFLLFLHVCGRPSKNGQSYRRRIQKVLDELGYGKNVDLIYAIAQHETGNFSSRVFKECNNAFGLKTFQMTRCMAPAAEGAGLYYQDFDALEDSVKAFIKWLERRGAWPGISDDGIKVIMGSSGYFQDSEYFKKVEKWMRKN